MRLRKINIYDEELFKQAFDRFPNEDFYFAYKYDPNQSFKTYLELVESWERGNTFKEDEVPATMLLAEVAGEVVGRISIRHELNDFLARIGGHVGYGVFPEHRGKGYGTEILRLGKEYIKDVLGLEQIFITCDETNIASIKIIENNGGVFQDQYNGVEVDIPKNRYWIQLK